MSLLRIVYHFGWWSHWTVKIYSCARSYKITDMFMVNYLSGSLSLIKTSLIPMSFLQSGWKQGCDNECRRRVERDLSPAWPVGCCLASSKPSGPIHLTGYAGDGAAWIIDGLNLTRHRWQGDSIQQLLRFARAICCHKNICHQGHPVTLS